MKLQKKTEISAMYLGRQQRLSVEDRPPMISFSHGSPANQRQVVLLQLSSMFNRESQGKKEIT